jgi:hypothetical protein
MPEKFRFASAEARHLHASGGNMTRLAWKRNEARAVLANWPDKNIGDALLILLDALVAAKGHAVIMVLGDAMLWLTSTPREFARSRTPECMNRLMRQFSRGGRNVLVR